MPNRKLPRNSRWHALEAWFASPAGQRVIAAEQAWLTPWLERLFGYYLLNLSVAPAALSLTNSPIRTHFGISPVTMHDRLADSAHLHCLRGVAADFEQLPYATDSVDAVLLHHVLSYSQSPVAVVDEAARVLRPYGHLLVMGWQPWGVMGIAQRVQRLWHQTELNHYQAVRLPRLLDGLRARNFEILEAKHALVVPPQLSTRVQSLLKFAEPLAAKTALPLGSVYLVCARKIVPALPGGKTQAKKTAKLLPEIGAAPVAGCSNPNR